MSTKKESSPSYKSPGVYPSGSNDSLGLGSSNILQRSLGN